MKTNLLLIILTNIIFGIESCNSNKKENKIFLDFSLGMTEKKFSLLKDSLIEVKKIHYEENNCYSYTFNCPEDRSANVRLSPKFQNGYLINLKLEFGHYSYSSLSGKREFYNFECFKDLQSVLKMYNKKFGSFKKETFMDSGGTGEYIEHQIYSWDQGDFEITFHSGRKQNESYSLPGCVGEECFYSTGAYIEYKFDKENIEKINNKETDENFNDL